LLAQTHCSQSNQTMQGHRVFQEMKRYSVYKMLRSQNELHATSGRVRERFLHISQTDARGSETDRKKLSAVVTEPLNDPGGLTDQMSHGSRSLSGKSHRSLLGA